MSNHRCTERHFRRIEYQIAEYINAPAAEAIGVVPDPGRQLTTAVNDLAIGLVFWLRYQWATTAFTLDAAAEFHAHYALRPDYARGCVIAVKRHRTAAKVVHQQHPSTDVNTATVKTLATDLGEHQLAVGHDINESHDVALAAATLLAVNYLNCPVGFRGHATDETERALAAVYPEISVLRDTHPRYGDITLLL